MLPWITLLALPLFVSRKKLIAKIELRGACNYNIDLAMLFVSLYLFLFRALRANTVGGDIQNYEELFIYLGKAPWKRAISRDGYEIGYLVLNKVLYSIVPNFRIVIIVIAAISTYALFSFVKENSRKPWLSLYIYITLNFLGSSFNNERQALANAILLLSFKYIKSRKFRKFFALVLLATTIHATSFVFVVLYFVCEIKINARYWAATAIAILITFVLKERILRIVIALIPFYSNKYANVEFGGTAGYTLFVMMLIIMLSQIVLTSRKKLNEANYRIFAHMIVIATILQCFSLEINFFVRLVQTFFIGVIIYIPEAVGAITYGTKRIETITEAVLLVLLGGYYVWALRGNNIGLIPYSVL